MKYVPLRTCFWRTQNIGSLQVAPRVMASYSKTAVQSESSGKGDEDMSENKDDLEFDLDTGGEWQDYETFDNLDTANQFADALKNSLSEYETQIYTQVDVEGEGENSYAYLKGLHLVNRTGVYLVAWK